MTVTYPVKVELAVGTGTPPAWVDVSTYLIADEATTVAWGGSGEDIKVEPTRASFTLDNSDGRFTPGNAASPYYPLIRIGTGARVSVSVGGTWYVRFTGSTDEWDLSWKTPKYVPVSVTCTDYFKQLSRQQVPARGLFAEAVIGDIPRALFMLDDAGPPALPETTSQPTQLIPSISGDAKIDWQNTEPPPGVLGKALQFTPGTAQCYLSGQTEILRIYGATKTGQGISTTGTALAGWVNIPVAPTAEMFLFGYDGLFWLSLDTSLRLVIHSPTETGADQTTVGPAITVDGWHYVAARAQYTRNSGTTFTETWRHDFFVDGTYTYVDVASSSQTKTKVGTTARVGCYGGPGRAVFSCAGLSLWSWERGLSKPDFADQYLAAKGYAGSDTAGQRVARWLQLAGIDPYGPGSSVAASTIYVAAQDTGSATILALITDVVDTERGAFYTARDGTLTFRSRDQTLYHAAPDVTLPASTLLASPEFKLDDGDLANDVTVDGPTGITYRATDTDSIAQHGRYNTQQSTLDMASSAPQTLATWLVYFSAWPTPQCEKIGVELSTPGVPVAAVLGLTVGGIVRITGASSQAPSATVNLQIIGCTETITRNSYTFDLSTATADEFAAVASGWLLGDVTASVLGTTTILTL